MLTYTSLLSHPHLCYKDPFIDEEKTFFKNLKFLLITGAEVHKSNFEWIIYFSQKLYTQRKYNSWEILNSIFFMKAQLSQVKKALNIQP